MAPRLCNMISKPKLDIQITFTRNDATYITGDIVEGIAKVTSKSDLHFDEIVIELAGTAQTYNDCTIAAATTFLRPEAVHHFLKLRQPDLQRQYPKDSILQAGRTHLFSFCFTVPKRLSSHVCNHNIQDDKTHECHLNLPPSLGVGQSGSAPAVLDDMAPHMAKVQYETYVFVTELSRSSNGIQRRTLASTSKALRIVPLAQECPSIATMAQSKDYLMRDETLITKGLSKCKYGRLVVEAAQPQPWWLTSLAGVEARATAVVNVALRFHPDSHSCAPPDLRKLVAKLQATTHFTTNDRKALPTYDGQGTDPYQSLYRQQEPLSCSNAAIVEWKKQHRSSSCSSAIGSDATPYYYTANVSVEVNLPSKKTLVPTFHSCLISRVYSLVLTLNMTMPGKQTSVQLKIPVQLSCSKAFDDESDCESWSIEDEKMSCYFKDE